MGVLVSQILARIQRSKRDCSDGVALGFVNDVHGELLSRYSLRDDVLEVSLTAGVQEYGLDETAVMVEVASYVLDSNRSVPLGTLDPGEMDALEPGWRVRAAGTPARFWIGADLSGATIGLYPKPDAATSSGYPLVRLNVRRRQILTSLDSIPNGLLNGDAYVYGALRRFCEERHQDELPVWMDRERDAFLKLETYMSQRQQQQGARILPAFLRSRRTV